VQSAETYFQRDKATPTPRAQRHCAIEIPLAFDGLPAAMFAKENKPVSLK
jgi:hypothetical protein